MLPFCAFQSWLRGGPPFDLLLWITKLLSCRKTEGLRLQGETLWLNQVQVMSSLPQPREGSRQATKALPKGGLSGPIQPHHTCGTEQRPQELQFKWIKVYVEEESFLSKLLCVLVPRTCLPVWLGDSMVTCRYRGPREQAQLLCDTAQLWLLKGKKDHVVGISCAWGD